MEQKKVKIIGLAINQNLGILEAASLEFNEKNNLISIHGEVGAGKTTLQKGLMLGTQGSDTLKADKKIYGQIDLEVQLLDGETPVFVGCKSVKDGSLEYVLYTKDADGKKTENPIIDGEKATPAKYLKLLQTKLTWRLDELMNDNPTVQKKILLEIYRPELAKIGIIFDKNALDWTDSILDKIEKAEAKRTEADFYRKQRGGFSKHLLEVGVNTDRPETIPERINEDELTEKINALKYDIANFFKSFDKTKENDLLTVKNKAITIISWLKDINAAREKADAVNKSEHDAKVNKTKNGKAQLDFIKKTVIEFGEKYGAYVTGALEEFEKLTFEEQPDFKPVKLISFNEEGQCIEPADGDEIEEVKAKLIELNNLRTDAGYINKRKAEEGPEKQEADLLILEKQLKAARQNNGICDACDSFYKWQEQHNEVLRLKNEYFQLLTSIETGVSGLRIVSDEGENIFLQYNGEYAPDYFGNAAGEFRKLSSYSDTQKPVICLLVQSHLLNKKAKAMRYLWIDKIPIDKKTKTLLEKMGKNLGVTIFVNITGDFEKSDLKEGEILINNGHLIFG